MPTMIQTDPSWSTNELLAAVLSQSKDGERVQFLVEPRSATHVVQRLRVALSRARNRNKQAGQLSKEFTLRHQIYPYTQDGKRYSCVVMWTERLGHHIAREMLDDLMER